ncbi:Ig-like domain-containing protein [Agrococcus beijingensis]|uniref:Ig-like domain-containing protein n=1 Tax=Agrococcus beijingensis TaxID=3068634 RepID=UPI002741FDEE|nr:Ig-like domain-containing protein [Agrococcus sp. REN33]
MKRGRLGLALGSILVSGIVVGAVLSPGYQAIEPQLDGSSVWVANGGAGAIGLANTANATIERTIEVGGVDEAHQTPSGTVIVDRDASAIRVVREGAAQAGPAVPIDAGALVVVRDDRIAITSPTTGDVWRTTAGAIAEGIGLDAPVVALGRGGVAALSETSLLAASPGLGRVLRVDDDGEIASSDRAPVSPSAPDLQLTALGDQWVLYDAGSGVLSTSTWQTAVDATDVRLQEPGPDASAVLYATDDSLVRQQLGVPAATTLASGTSGQPARPVVSDGCVYAAWRDGTGWRSCEGEESVVLALQGVSLDATLRILQRGSATALVDSGTGDAWAIDRSGARIEGWQVDDDQPAPQAPSDGETVEETVEAAPVPPVAEDDELGARPGAVTVLPVLLNDSDANGDPLVITEIATDRSDASATITPDGRSIRLEAPDSGATRIDYAVSDGVEDDTAVATVLPRVGNEPPELVRPAQATLETGGTLVLDALDGWLDPDGDPLAVVGASVEAPDRVSVRADGRLEFTDGGSGAEREVQVTVSDGRATSTAPIVLTVHAGTVAIGAQPVTAVTRVGQELVLEPLLAARGGEGELSLHNVIAPGLPVEPSFAEGTIRVRPDGTGLLRFAYVVTDGVTTMEGRVLVRVLDATDASSAPVTMPVRAALPPIGTVALDVDDLAYDPSGGVLALALASSDDPAVRAEVVDAEQLRLSLVDDLDGQAAVRFTVTNGVQSSTGQLLVSTTGAAAVQSPIARDDLVTVRPGGLVDIPVLANDEQPDGLPLELQAEIVAPPEGGLLFADGERMRFVAPATPGTFTATYAVRGPDGQIATADITLQVAAAARTTNAAPAVPTVEARVVGGASVDLPLPLSSADPNGDPVQLLGPSTAPSQGFVTQAGRSTLRYQAGDYARGIDEFRYRIVDDQGASAEGLVRVVVVEPSPALPPVLGGDRAAMRPDSTLVVPVLDNDSDPAGLPLEIVDVQTASPGASAEIRDDAVLVTAGPGSTDIGVVVTVENSAGTAAASWLRLDVDPAAPPPPPDVLDVQVAIQSIAEADAVRIDPLDHATVRDGRTDALAASLPLITEGVVLRDDGTIEIAVADRTRFVPFTVARTDDPSAQTTAVIAVPGRRDALPQLKAGVAPLTVSAGETLEIAVDDVVDTVDGQGAEITDASTVQASPTDGSNPVIDLKTLRFVPQPGYFGPASITFEVTDGDGAGDPDGRVATIVLPIEVLAGDGVPLTVLGSFVQLEPGTERVIDLGRVTRAPDPARLAGASWSLAGTVPEGFQASIAGAQLTVRALDQTDPGTIAELPIGVRDSAGVGLPGAIVLSVISTTAPLAAPLPDEVTVQRGAAATVSPLLNDEASNPFPTTPLRIGAMRDGGAAQRGITAAVSGDTVQITASPGAVIGATIVQVLVLDATGQPGRGVWSPITVTVQDVPDAPAPPVQAFEEHIDGVVTMAIEPPVSNGSPITGYRVVNRAAGVDVACGATPRCRIEGLPPGVELRLQAIATNALGDSLPSEPSEPVHADQLPALVPGVQAAPSTAPGAVRVVWQGVPQPAGGTPIEAYLVRVSGGGLDQLVRVGANERAAVVSGLTPGRAYSIEVAATNRAGVPDASWRWPAAPLPFTAVGQPATGPVLITGNDGGRVTVRWSAVDAGGAAAVRYTAHVEPIGAVHACTSTGTGTPAGDTALEASLPIADGSRSVVAVTADNGWHCSVSVSDPIFGTPMPVDPSAATVAAGVAQAQARDDAVDLQLVRAPTPADGTWLEARVTQAPQTVEPAWVRVSQGSWLTPTQTAFGYGRTANVELRVCAPSGAGAGGVCSEPRGVGAEMPLSLRAEVVTCRPLVPLDARPPANATLLAQGSVVASYLVGAAWSPERPSTEPVPAGATEVRARGVVTYAESGAPQEYRDLLPTVAGCGL